MQKPLLALKDAVKGVLKLHLKEPVRSPTGPVDLEQLQEPGCEGERLVWCIEAVLVHGLHLEAEAWHYILNLERESIASQFALGAQQVKVIRHIPDLPDAVRLRQWVRLALNQSTLLSALQLLALFPMITWAYYQDAAILRTEEDSAVLYSVLAPVGGLPWTERKLMIDEMGDAASKRPLFSKDTLRFDLRLQCAADALLGPAAPSPAPAPADLFEAQDDIVAARLAPRGAKERRKKRDGAKKVDAEEFARAKDEWQRERKALLTLLEQQQLAAGEAPHTESPGRRNSASHILPLDGEVSTTANISPTASGSDVSRSDTDRPAASASPDPEDRPTLSASPAPDGPDPSLALDEGVGVAEVVGGLPPPGGAEPAAPPDAVEREVPTPTEAVLVTSSPPTQLDAEPAPPTSAPSNLLPPDLPLPTDGSNCEEDHGAEEVHSLLGPTSPSLSARTSTSSGAGRQTPGVASSTVGPPEPALLTETEADGDAGERTACWRARRAARAAPVETADPMYPVYLYYHNIVHLAQSLASTLPTSDACGLEFQLFLLAQRQQFASLLYSWGERGAEVRAALRDTIPEAAYHVPPLGGQWAAARGHHPTASYDSADSSRPSIPEVLDQPTPAPPVPQPPAVVPNGPRHGPTISITSDDWFATGSEGSTSSIVVTGTSPPGPLPFPPTAATPA
eukprot:EG_transcript_5192